MKATLKKWLHYPYQHIQTRPSMPLSERAGIFQPFSALSGLHEAILTEQQRHSNKVKPQKGTSK